MKAYNVITDYTGKREEWDCIDLDIRCHFLIPKDKSICDVEQK